MISCTVAIPVYNRPELTRRAIESALAQGVDGLEVLAVDDCSPEDVGPVLQAVEDSRFRAVRNDRNLGLFANFNRCLELARGRHVRILCCDDALTPGTLRREIALLDAHPQVAILSTRGLLVDASGRRVARLAQTPPAGIYPRGAGTAAMLWLHAHYGLNPFNYPSGVLVRREAALQAGGFELGMKVAGDVAFFLRLMEHGDLAVVDDLGCSITCHPQQVGTMLQVAGFEIREWLELAGRYGGVLDKFGSRGSVRRHLAGLATGMALDFRRRGSAEGERVYWEIVKETGVGTAARLSALAGILSRRVLLRKFGWRHLPRRLRPPPPARLREGQSASR